MSRSPADSRPDHAAALRQSTCECDTCHETDKTVPGTLCGYCGLGIMQLKRKGRSDV